MSKLQCVIRTRGGDEIKKTSEVTGSGKSYLSSLSADLCQMQLEVNTFLTQLVEKEKAEKTSIPKGRNGGGDSSEKDEGRSPLYMSILHVFCVGFCQCRHGGR